ncbi:hypothetical protein [Pelistega ratti]|uniref:hypothetical protein n=1 Tax=Pelistega ratti TaxID=2652177 RepID=UPI00135C310F|nr:hypothetical protein [Pelistega ratti]
MAKLINYDNETGRIISILDGDLGSVWLNRGEHFLLGVNADMSIHYVKNGIVTERPSQQTVLKNATLQNLPVPCEITINGKIYECTDDKAELEFNQLGTYEITVSAFPYLDWSITYENQAQ